MNELPNNSSEENMKNSIDLLQAKIDEQNKEIEILKSKNAGYSTVFNHLFDMILIIDGKTGKIIEVNQISEQLLGYKPEELIGRHFRMLFEKNDDQETDELLNDIKIFGPVLSYRKVIKKDGSIRLMDMTINTIKYFDNHFILTNLRDAMERAKAEDELRHISIQLTEINKTKDKFFSIIAHDLKNPFNSLLGFSELLTTEYDDLTDDEKRLYIDEIRKVSKSSYQLLDNLLHWARAQTGKIQYLPNEFDLRYIVTEVISLIDAQAKAKNIDIKIDIKNNLAIFADDDLLMTVIRNLLTNAIKYSNPFSSIEIKGNISGINEAVLSIRDWGVGISPNLKNTLFNIDRGESRSGTMHEKGTGLGLILCKEFIELNKGKIWFENNSDCGTTFFITIPTEEIIESEIDDDLFC
ncbi:MAG: PAS domain-containing sensor histidine kinase [bacterium]